MPQFADLPLQRLHFLGHLGRDTGALAAVDLGLLHSFMQRLRNAADLLFHRHHGCPSGQMIRLVIENHPSRPLEDFGRIVVRRLACRGFTLSGVGASDRSGAVQTGNENARVTGRASFWSEIAAGLMVPGSTGQIKKTSPAFRRQPSIQRDPVSHSNKRADSVLGHNRSRNAGRNRPRRAFRAKFTGHNKLMLAHLRSTNVRRYDFPSRRTVAGSNPTGPDGHRDLS